MNARAIDAVVDALRANGKTVLERGGDRYEACCPAHDDRTPSLSIGLRDDGKGVVIKCQAGCDYLDVLAAVGLTARDLFDEPRMRAAYSPRNTYRYPDGRIVYRKPKPNGQPGKDFHQSGNTKGTALYHADRIGDACLVYVAEGEKDVDVIEQAGGTAVTSAMGAGKADKFDWWPLKGLDVIIIADRDGPGRGHVCDIAGLLDGLAASVRVMEAKTGKDLADHIAAGYTLAELVPVEVECGSSEPPDAHASRQADQDGSRFIDPHTGLRVRSLADAVMATVTCGFGKYDGRFYTYEGGVWAPGAERIETQISELLGERYRDAHCRNTLNKIRLNRLTQRISCDPLPDYINVRNGMVDWVDGVVLEHSPEFGSTVQIPFDYREDADCPQIDKFFTEVLPADCYTPTDDCPQGFIWEVIGYTLYSGNPLHIAILLRGGGRNGKGTLIRLLLNLLGERNCCSATLHELVENRFRTASLYGKLANLAGDLNAGWLDNTATFKAITAGDEIQGEHKYGHPFDFTPWAVPVYSANRTFGCADTSEAWAARWVVIPFPNSYAGREDRKLVARLNTEPELRGMLYRGIQALPALMARGRMAEPDSVQQAKANFLRESDAVRSWFADQAKRDPDAFTERTDIYNNYLSYAETSGVKKPLKASEFYIRLEQINGIRATRHHGGTRGFTGIRLNQTTQTTQTVTAVTVPYTPSRTRGKKGREPVTPVTQTCDICNTPLEHPTSITRGLCLECQLLTNTPPDNNHHQAQ